MLSYSSILRQSYNITLRNRVLWLFGLFVAGGFNLNFLRFQNIPAKDISDFVNIHELAGFFSSHPVALATLSISILIFSILGLVATNWCRVMLVLVVESILKTRFAEVYDQAVKSKYPLWTIIKVSLITSTVIVFASLALLLPPLFISSNSEVQIFLWIGSCVLLLPIIFLLSCLNIFTSYYVIIYKVNLSKALNLATDFLASKWVEILGLALLLIVIYFVCFFVGVSFIYLLKLLFNGLLEQFTNFDVSAIILISNLISNIMIWLLLGVLNVFINTALLLLFLQINTPVEHGEKVVEQVPAAYPAS